MNRENKKSKPRPIAGQAALDELVGDKKLRLATSADIEAWVKKASEPYKKFNDDLRVTPRMLLGRTYVVLEELVLPDGLYGGHSRSFILPEGVPFPGGPAGHNSFYSLKTGEGQGPGAR